MIIHGNGNVHLSIQKPQAGLSGSYGNLGGLWGAYTYTRVTASGYGTPGAKITISGSVSCTTTVAESGIWTCDMPYSVLGLPNSDSKTTIASKSYSVTVKQECTECCPASSASFSFSVSYNQGTPIAIDFSGQGAVQTVSADQAPATFDLLGDGRPVQSGWLAPSAGFLVYDADGNGQVDSVDELFGGAAGEGYARLARFDTNGDGVIDPRDAGYYQLQVWRDQNLNKAVDAGELTTLLQAGVISLDLDHVDYWTTDAQGNAAYDRSTATLAGGRTAAMADVYFSYTPATK
ncbi:MAG: hypothetical protein FWH11_12200 [Micrococcales bacterium]|nr:hypothetical protein [Micrococcales bacterium]